jgi:exopolysaccharide biosynthesis operon protein EpsL
MGTMALIGSVYSMPVLADTFTPYVGAGLTYVDNLFRLSDEQMRIDKDSADTARSVIGGLRFERPVGRQLLNATAEFSSVKYDRNSQLNYLGKNVSGEWHWFVAEHFEGHIGGLYVEELPSFSDFHVFQRNLRITKRQYVDGSWRFHPSWQSRLSYVKEQYSYDLPALRASNREDESVIANFDYLAASGSTIGVQFRRLKDSFPNGQLLSTDLFAGGYVQQEAKVNVLWLATGTTQVTFLGGYVQRKQQSNSDRTDTGTNARLVVNWAPTGRVKAVGQAWREFAPIEGVLVSSSLNTGASAGATWDYAETFQVLANLKRERRKFVPVSTADTSFASGYPGDITNSASVGLIYKPLRSVSLKLGVFRDKRSGNSIGGTNSFKVNGVSLFANKVF